MAPALGGGWIVALPVPGNLRSRLSRRDSRCGARRRYLRPDAMDGIMSVPLKAMDDHLDTSIHGVPLRTVIYYFVYATF